MTKLKTVTVDSQNFEKYGLFCVQNRKHHGFDTKAEWLQENFTCGLRMKMILTPDEKIAGFLEYIPGEYTWRVVHALDYLVIHCLWVKSSRFPYQGMASRLLEECINEADSSGKNGVAVVTSDGPWMAGSEVYLKNGFTQLAEAPPRFQLLVKQIRGGPLPSFPDDWNKRLQNFQGWNLIYTHQCPYIGKAMEELPPVAEKFGIRLQMIELTDPADARQRMPSPYGVISLVYNGRLLADHPISATRFRNILQKEL